MPRYHGHPSRNQWNVALWIGNDEGLYRMALDFIRASPNRGEASRRMYYALKEARIEQTPDGAPYSITAIRHAMEGLT